MLKPVDTESLQSSDPRRITSIVPRSEAKMKHEKIEDNYHRYFIQKTHEQSD